MYILYMYFSNNNIYEEDLFHVYLIHVLLKQNHISSAMVSMFVLSAVDCGFNPQSSQTKDYKFQIAFPLSMHN
jgi:hypothetical protein